MRPQNGTGPRSDPRAGEGTSGQDAGKHSRTHAAGKPRGWRIDTDGDRISLVGPHGELVLLALLCIDPVRGDLDRVLRRLVHVGRDHHIPARTVGRLAVAIGNILIGNAGGKVL